MHVLATLLEKGREEPLQDRFLLIRFHFSSPFKLEKTL